MTQSVLQSDLHIVGRMTCQTATLPSSCVSNSNVASDAAIASTKVVHRKQAGYSTAAASDPATITVPLMIARYAGSIDSFDVGPMSQAGTGDRSVAVDLQKSTGGGAFATVLSGAITINASDAIRSVSAGTISDSALAAGDILQLVITVTAGTTGNYPRGILSTVNYSENPL